MACETTVIDYRRFGTRQLEDLDAQASRLETDFERRLGAQLSRADLPFSHQTANPDPVAKRLGFLLAKVRDERRALQRELATRRHGGDGGMRDIVELHWKGSCAEDPPFIHDDSSARSRTLLPAAVALLGGRPMELALLAFAAIGVMISIWGKYSYEHAGGRLRDLAIDSPTGVPRIVDMPPHDVVIDRARSELAPPQSRRRHRPMREQD